MTTATRLVILISVDILEFTMQLFFFCTRMTTCSDYSESRSEQKNQVYPWYTFVCFDLHPVYSEQPCHSSTERVANRHLMMPYSRTPHLGQKPLLITLIHFSSILRENSNQKRWIKYAHISPLSWWGHISKCPTSDRGVIRVYSLQLLLITWFILCQLWGKTVLRGGESSTPC